MYKWVDVNVSIVILEIKQNNWLKTITGGRDCNQDLHWHKTTFTQQSSTHSPKLHWYPHISSLFWISAGNESSFLPVDFHETPESCSMMLLSCRRAELQGNILNHILYVCTVSAQSHACSFIRLNTLHLNLCYDYKIIISLYFSRPATVTWQSCPSSLILGQFYISVVGGGETVLGPVPLGSSVYTTAHMTILP